MNWNVPRSLKRLTLAAVGLVTLQLTLWLTVGIWTLPSYVPEMIINDTIESERSLAERGEPLPTNDAPHYYVMCPRLADRVTQSEHLALQDLMAPRNVFLFTEEQAAANIGIEPGTASNVDPLCFFVDWNTPLVAYVEYGERDCGLCSWGIGHRAWFILGFWFPTDSVTSWVS